jgi:hypothetical protein
MEKAREPGMSWRGCREAIVEDLPHGQYGVPCCCVERLNVEPTILFPVVASASDGGSPDKRTRIPR